VKRSPVKAKRATPRRREAPQGDRAWWEAANQSLFARSGGLCEICAKVPWTERHHRKRRRDGGDRLCNLLALCTECHKHVTEHPAEARRYGWIVSVYRDPELVPVLWRRREWCTLGDDGALFPAFALDEDAHA
jgi:5-methylcytosine-specific restriction endonuclease McrA